MIDKLARVPVAVVAAALVLGGVLADVHTFVVVPAVRDSGSEPAQWMARVGIMLYFLILPLALLAVWARRRQRLGRAGVVAAVLMAVQVPCYVVLMLAGVVWGLLLGRGDLGSRVLLLHDVGVTAFYLGVVVLAVRMLMAGRATALLGGLLLGGFVVSFIVPFGLAAALVAFAAAFLAQEVGSARVLSPAH